MRREPRVDNSALKQEGAEEELDVLLNFLGKYRSDLVGDKVQFLVSTAVAQALLNKGLVSNHKVYANKTELSQVILKAEKFGSRVGVDVLVVGKVYTNGILRLFLNNIVTDKKIKGPLTEEWERIKSDFLACHSQGAKF